MVFFLIVSGKMGFVDFEFFFVGGNVFYFGLIKESRVGLVGRVIVEIILRLSICYVFR